MLLETAHLGRTVPCPHCHGDVRTPSEPWQPPPERAEVTSRGQAALVLAITALVGMTCGNMVAAPLGMVVGLLAPVAWKLAADERRRLRETNLPPDGTTNAAYWLGMITTVLMSLCCAGSIVAIAVLGASALGDLSNF
jgi:ethanolamine utilization microcompartment shell protein EutL